MSSTPSIRRSSREIKPTFKAKEIKKTTGAKASGIARTKFKITKSSGLFGLSNQCGNSGTSQKPEKSKSPILACILKKTPLSKKRIAKRKANAKAREPAEILKTKLKLKIKLKMSLPSSSSLSSPESSPTPQTIRSSSPKSIPSSISASPPPAADHFPDPSPAVYYFAYGADMCETYMMKHYPEAFLVGLAVLRDHRWTISSSAQPIVVDSSKKNDDRVYGIVYRMPYSCLKNPSACVVRDVEFQSHAMTQEFTWSCSLPWDEVKSGVGEGEIVDALVVMGEEADAWAWSALPDGGRKAKCDLLSMADQNAVNRGLLTGYSYGMPFWYADEYITEFVPCPKTPYGIIW